MAREADFRWVSESIGQDEILKRTSSCFFQVAEKDRGAALKIIDNAIYSNKKSRVSGGDEGSQE